eukprot:g15902.t1
MRSMVSSSGGGWGGRREKGLLKTRPSQWKRSDPGGQLPWFGENDDILADPCRSVPVAQSPQSMLLTADQNNIMRLPNYSCFMHHQENLQALLVDIYEDPEGFKEFVETRRDARTDRLGEVSVTAATAGRESLSDYTNLSEVSQGRFSVVFYAENKRTRLPCAMKRIKLEHLKIATDKGKTSPEQQAQPPPPQQQPGHRGQRRAARATATATPSPEESTAASEPPAAPATSPQSTAAIDEETPPGGGSLEGRTTSQIGPAASAAAGMAPWEGRLSRMSVGREGGHVKEGGGRKSNGRAVMTYEHCLKEVGLLKNLTSPNIVQLHTWFLDGNALWVVMDWVDGGDLRGLLERTKKAGNRLSELTIWRLFTQICDGLLHMHGERIMHRDLKPANILISRDGTVKLGDLGLGRYLDVHSVLAMSRVGTPLYMSPETLKGRGHGMVSDIWSLGCVLYELTMLASPFEGRHLTLKTLFRKIVRADYPPIDNTLYNEHFANLVAHLLIPDPNARPKISVVQPAAHLALDRALQDATEDFRSEQLATAANASDAPEDLHYVEA